MAAAPQRTLRLRTTAVLTAVAVGWAVAGCGAAATESLPPAAEVTSTAARTSAARPTAAPSSAAPPTAAPSTAPEAEAEPAPRESATPTARPPATRATSPSRSPEPGPRVLASDGKPRTSRLSIPALDIDDLKVKPHRGAPDDARGTRIQDRGIAASPYGPDGGVGPGGIGNHIITAHRLSSTRAFLELPRLRVGAKVHLEAGGQRYTYRIVKTRKTSFRSKKSLAAQAAPVPGKPGVRATTAMITLSTCRTPEDRAEGNFWSDEFGNPEHRIDKIGELVSIRPL